MEENNEMVKITYVKNLNRINFDSTVSVAIDSNVNIKTILSVKSFVFDEKIECGTGKALYSGKVGVKAVYVDTDGITNSVAESVAFSENIVDQTITNNSFICVTNQTLHNNILSSEGVLKIGCQVNANPILYLNLGLNNKCENFENMVVKKNELLTSTISNFISTDFDYNLTFETRDELNKVLCCDTHFVASNVLAKENFAVVEGKIFANVVYEIKENEETTLKQICDTFNVKVDVPVDNLQSESILNLHFAVDKNCEKITTEKDGDNNIISVDTKFKVCGVAMQNISIDVIDDMYSTENEINLSTSQRSYIKNYSAQNMQESFSNETTMEDDETIIDEIISNQNISPEVTNTYVKDDKIYVEGIITSNVVFFDENRDIKQKVVEVPFVINTKFESKENCTSNVSVLDCKVKQKRGTILEVDYTVNVCVEHFETETAEIIDNVTLGKALDFGQFDFQLYIAKPEETLWQLGKRIKIEPEEISKCNPNLPLVLQGGERVIIKR